MKTLSQRLAALISVKKLIALALTAVFAVLVLNGVTVDETFKTVYLIIIGFYFGQSTVRDTQSQIIEAQKTKTE